MNTGLSKIGHDYDYLENKVVQKLKLEKNLYKKWSPKLIFLKDF